MLSPVYILCHLLQHRSHIVCFQNDTFGKLSIEKCIADICNLAILFAPQISRDACFTMARFPSRKYSNEVFQSALLKKSREEVGTNSIV